MNILLIQILRFGDALQMTPILKGLKQSFPSADIHVLTSVIGKEIFERQAEVDEIFVLHKQELADLVRHSKIEDILSATALLQSDLKPILDKKWDWVINFSFSFPSALLAFIADGAHCSGFCAAKNRQYIFKEKWFAYCVSSFVNRKYSIFNWVDINKKIIGLKSVPAKPAFDPDEEEVREAEKHLKQIGFAEKPILGIHPGASSDYKRWPLENFIELGKRLVDKHNYKILIFGGKSEAKLAEEIVKALGPDVQDLTGRTTLSQLAAYISLCSLVVSNDSGPMHLASALSVPIIALFFSTHFIETGPYGRNNIVINPDIPCFPCQGTASCAGKECLNYIKPHTVEKIIINRKRLIEGRKQLDLDESDGPISVNVSGFDPWGNLEWVRLGNPSMQFDDLLRIVFRLGWLSCLDTVDDHKKMDEYLKTSLKRFSVNRDNTDITQNLNLFTNDLGKLKEVFNQGHKLCIEIQSALLEPNVNIDRIQRIGSELQKKEEAIISLGGNPRLSPFIEYFRLSLENIVEKEIFRLSKITKDVYMEMLRLIGTIKGRLTNIRPVQQIGNELESKKRNDMGNKIRKLLIAIPTVRGILPETFMCFMALERLAANGKIGLDIDYKVFSNDSLLPRVRNSAISRFLECDYDYFMTIDDDIGFSPESISALMSNNKDIVCAVYPMRSPDFPLYSVRVKLEKKSNDEFNINIEAGHLIELRYASTGFLLVRRNVVEAMAAAYAEEAYEESLPERFGKSTYNFYNPMVITHSNGKKEYLSEDWAFCERARRLGFRIWGDINIPIGHSGTVSIMGKKGNELTEALMKQSKEVFNLYYR